MDGVRSLLSVPGDQVRMLARAPDAGADAICLDLEDSVSPAEKQRARELVIAAIDEWEGRVRTWVRVNAGPAELLRADLESVARPGVEGIQLPKAHDADAVRRVDAELHRLEGERGLAQGSIGILVSLESARGVQHASEILSAADRVRSVMPGTARDGDLQRDLGIRLGPDEAELDYVRSAVNVAARAAGIGNPIDGVYADHRDDDGLRLVSARARRLGYRGKKVIHPRQVPIVNDVFAPTAEELAYYQRVLAAIIDADAAGRGTAVVDGRMVDVAMAETARAYLALAR
jgi:citrate lyase subunit beta / citryl-CoA lyase